MRIAVIDIGTNTTLLLVAEASARGLAAVEERATITRLGQGVDRSRVLHDAAIERTNTCLAEYAERIEALEATRVVVVGTSALRDAQGGERIRDFIESRFETELRVISGRDEATLTFRGAVSGLGIVADSSPLVAFDVGGGSTEIVQGVLAPGELGSPRLDYAESFDVGSVRLTERHITTDPPTSLELQRVADAAEAAFARLPTLAKDAPPIGIAGTVTTLAAISLGMTSYDGARVHGQTMAVGEVERIVADLARRSVSDRQLTPGLHPGRADVIVAGGLVVLAVLRRLGAHAMRVSDRGLRWGLAAEAAIPANH
jgi:exopolyphosphatase/guanosine-5'-triphosphate,3'-diphosphate pyrophosphatase